MPEGHTIHRLAAAFEHGFGGQRLRASSPQGRFPEAADIDGWVLASAEAAGKHLFLGFTPEAQLPPGHPATRYVHVHLGLYGSWTFAGEEGFVAAPAIGAPRTVPGGGTRDHEEREDWRRLLPRETVRLRLSGPSGLADLTGPTACALLDAPARAAILDRLGPDPLREDADPTRFVERVRGSRRPVGVQLMDQSVLAGIGNIYRAELLFRARLDPTVPGTDLGPGILEGIWEDLVPLLGYGARTGRIVTTQPEHRHLEARIIERSRGTRQNGDGDPSAIPREESFYVYHRHTLPCRLCGTTVRSGEMAARTVFWCPDCQRPRRRRSAWSRDHPASDWA